MAAYTKTPDVQPSFPGFVNIRFESGRAVLTVRGDPKVVAADKDSTEHIKAAPTVTLELEQVDWDQFVAEATRERGLVPGG